MKNYLTILTILMVMHLHSNAAWISIKSFNVDTTTANQLKINYSLEESVTGWFISKHDVYYSVNLDTVNIRVYRLLPSGSFQSPQIIDSSITIPIASFNALCYLNFFNAADTNTVNPLLNTEPNGYDIDTAQYNFNHCAPLGISKQTLAKTITVYPNPSATNWAVDCGENFNDQLNYMVTDVFGKILYKNSSNTGQFTINHSKLSAGIYFLHVTINNASSSSQLIKL
jgi:Secretion system C-terminal sorting domain